jgi:hypothetical protein
MVSPIGKSSSFKEEETSKPKEKVMEPVPSQVERARRGASGGSESLNCHTSLVDGVGNGRVIEPSHFPQSSTPEVAATLEALQGEKVVDEKGCRHGGMEFES